MYIVADTDDCLCIYRFLPASEYTMIKSHFVLFFLLLLLPCPSAPPSQMNLIVTLPHFDFTRTHLRVYLLVIKRYVCCLIEFYLLELPSLVIFWEWSLTYMVLCKPGLLIADQVVHILKAKYTNIFLHSQVLRWLLSWWLSWKCSFLCYP